MNMLGNRISVLMGTLTNVLSKFYVEILPPKKFYVTSISRLCFFLKSVSFHTKLEKESPAGETIRRQFLWWKELEIAFMGLPRYLKINYLESENLENKNL